MNASREQLIVTLDGPAGSGKSTLARLLAEKLDGVAFSSGILYRWLGHLAVLQGTFPPVWSAAQFTFEPRDYVLTASYQNRPPSPELHSPSTASAASQIAVLPEIRSALLPIQRGISFRPLIADGRDMGTVVFPDAPIQFFVTAGVGERALRRLADLKLSGAEALHEMEEEIIRRDRRDSERELAPLRPSEKAVKINTDGATPEQSIQLMIEYIASRFPDL